MSGAWKLVDGKTFSSLQDSIREAIGHKAGKLTAYWRNVPFYKDGILMSAHVGRRDWFMVLSQGKLLTLLDGSSGSLLAANRRSKLAISPGNVADYIHYFYTFGRKANDRDFIISGVPEGFELQGKARRIVPLHLCRQQSVAGQIRVIITIHSHAMQGVWRLLVQVGQDGHIRASHQKLVGKLVDLRPHKAHPFLPAPQPPIPAE